MHISVHRCGKTTVTAFTCQVFTNIPLSTVKFKICFICTKVLRVVPTDNPRVLIIQQPAAAYPRSRAAYPRRKNAIADRANNAGNAADGEKAAGSRTEKGAHN